MKNLIQKIGLVIFCCFFGLQMISAQDSKGTDFWLMFVQNYNQVPTLTLFISSDVSTSGSVAIPGLSFSTTFSTTAGAITPIVVPSSAQQTTTGIANLGIHVTSADEVTVHGFNERQYTTDAFLGFPSDALGQSYRVLAYQGLTSAFPSEVGIVAAEPGTTSVVITPSVGSSVGPAGVPVTVTLTQGQTFLIKGSGAADISGTTITSDKNIAVFSGAVCSNVPTNCGACDHLIEQMTPLSAWGVEFVTVPLATRNGGDIFRVMANVSGTVIQKNGSPWLTLSAGQVHEELLSGYNFIESNEPIMIGQYSRGTGCDGVTSDPFFALVPPTDQYLPTSTFNSGTASIPNNYVNIVSQSSFTSFVTLDGVPIPPASWTAIPGSTLSAAQLPVSLGQHIAASNFPIGVLAYGFGSADSYGYLGSQSFSPVATVANISATPATQTVQQGLQVCVNATVTDQFGDPVVGVNVQFQVTGANSELAFDDTDANGLASYCYYTDNAGNDNVEASISTLFDNVSATILPSVLSLTPATQTVLQGNQVCVTATLLDQSNNPVVGAPIDLSASGVNTASNTIHTNSSGEAQFCYTGANLGNDNINAVMGGLSQTATAEIVDCPAITATISGSGTYCPNTSQTVDLQITVSGGQYPYHVDVSNGNTTTTYAIPDNNPYTTSVSISQNTTFTIVGGQDDEECPITGAGSADFVFEDTEDPYFVDPTAILLYDNDFESPHSAVVRDNVYDDTNVSGGINTFYGTASYTFQQIFTVEVLLVNGPDNRYTDPNGQADDHVLGMLSTEQEDRLSLTFDTQLKDYLNVSFDFSAIDLYSNNAPVFGITTPIMNLKVYDSPGGAFNINNPGTLLDEADLTGYSPTSGDVFNWKTVLAGLDVSNSTDGNVSLVWDLVQSGYGAFDNLKINASDLSITDIPADETITVTDGQYCPSVAGGVSLTPDPSAALNAGDPFTVHGKTFYIPDFYDNCEADIYLQSIDYNATGTNLPCQRVIELVWLLKDVGNNSVTENQLFTVTDEDDLAVTDCPDDILLDALPDDCERDVVITPPTVENTCEYTRKISFSDENLVSVVDTTSANHQYEFNVGSVDVTYTYTDACGRQESCTFNVTIVDDTNPTFAKCDVDTIIETDLGICHTTHSFLTPIVYDACGVMMLRMKYVKGTPEPIAVPADVMPIGQQIPVTATFEKGETIVRFIAMDFNGNVDSCEFSVLVEDNEYPVFEKPADVTLTTDIDNAQCPQSATTSLSVGQIVASNFGFTVAGVSGFSAPTNVPYGTASNAGEFHDNCPDWEIKVYAIDNSNDLCDNTITITWRVTDCGNNYIDKIQKFRIIDDTPAAGTTPDGETDVNACKDETEINALLPTSDDEAAIEGAYSDNCGTVSATYLSQTLSGTNCSWSLVRTFKVSDGCPNNDFTITMTHTGGDEDPAAGNPPSGYQGVNTCADTDSIKVAHPYADDIAAIESAYTDDCGVVDASFVSEVLTGDNCGWTLVRTYNISDGCPDNDFTIDITYTGSDQDPATGTTPNGVDGVNACNDQAEIEALYPKSADEAAIEAAYSDDCGAVSASFVSEVMTGGQCGWMLARKYEVSDGCSANDFFVTMHYTGSDQDSPSGTTPGGQTNVNACADVSEINGLYPIASEISAIEAAYSDDCASAVTASYDGHTLTGGQCGWTLKRTYTISDGCVSNDTAVVITYTGSDQDPATGVTPLGVDNINECADVDSIKRHYPWSDDIAAIESAYSDDCGTVTATFVSEALTGGQCSWTLTRTYNVSDGCTNNDFTIDMVFTGSDQNPAAGTTPDGTDDINACADESEIDGLVLVSDDITALESAYTDDCGTVTATFDGQILTGDNCSWSLARKYIISDGCVDNNFPVTITHTGSDQDPATGTTPDGVDDVNACADESEIDGLYPTSDDELAIEGAYTDDCGTVTATFDGQVLSGDDCDWTLVRTYVVSDGCPANDFSVTITYTGSDQDAPVISGCPADQNMNAVRDACSRDFIFAPPTAVDDCNSVTRKIVFSDPTLVAVGDTSDLLPVHIIEYNVGTVTTYYIFTDECGNADTCQFDVTINDVTKPELTKCGYPTVISTEPGICEADFSFLTPVVNDACGVMMLGVKYVPGIPEPVSVPTDIPMIGQSFPVTETFQKGQTIVRFIAMDVNGNVDSCEFTVLVEDNEFPVFEALDDVTLTTTINGSQCPADVTTSLSIGNQLSSGAGFMVGGVAGFSAPVNVAYGSTLAPGEFYDNCPDWTINVYDIQTGNGVCQNTLTITWRVTDCDGNSVDHDQVFTIIDDTPAAGTTPDGVDDINACADESEIDGLYPTSDDETAIEGAYTDNCGTVSATFVSQTLSGDNCNWTLVRTYTVSDGCPDNDFDVTMTYTGSDQDPATGTTPLGVDDVNACASTTEMATLYPIANDEAAIAGAYTDDCGTVSATFDSEVLTGDNCSWSLVRTYIVSDGCSANNFPVTMTYTGSDQDPATGTTPDGVTGINACADESEIDGLYPTSDDESAIENAYTDDCGAIVATFLSQTLTGNNCSWSLERTFNVSDGCSANDFTVTMIYNGSDRDPATGTTPLGVDDINACADESEIDGLYPTSDDETAIEGAYTDDCGTVDATFVSQTLSGDNCSWTLVRTYNISDGCVGNDFTVTMTYTGSDQDPATGTTPLGVDDINACADESEIDGLYPTSDDETAIEGAYTDDCGTVVASFVSQVLSGDNCSWTLVRTYNITDGCVANDFTVTMTYTGSDQDPATGTTPLGVDDINACADESEIDGLYPTSDDESAIEGAYTDDCGTVVASFVSQVLSGDNCSWTLVRTYNITDGCVANDFTVTMTYTGSDQDPATGTTPNGTDDINACADESEIDGLYPTSDDESAIESAYTDDCGTVSATFAGQVLSGDDCDWSLERSFTVSDGCPANDFTVTMTHTGSDQDAPNIEDCPGDIIAYALQDDCKRNVSIPYPTATDDCNSVTRKIMFSDPSMVAIIDTSYLPVHLIEFNVGTVTTYYIFTDECGNADTCQFDVTINDVTKPTLAKCNLDATIDTDPGVCNAEHTFIIPEAYDACGVMMRRLEFLPGSPAPISVPAAVPQTASAIPFTATYEKGETIVRFIAMDYNGLSDTCEFSIVVEDNEGPEFERPDDVTLTTAIDGADCPADVTTSLSTGDIVSSGATFTVAGVTGQVAPIHVSYGSTLAPGEFYDNCPDWELKVLNVVTGNDLCENTLTITWRVTDCGGNFVDQDQIYTVIDDSPATGTTPLGVDDVNACADESEIDGLYPTSGDESAIEGAYVDNCGTVDATFVSQTLSGDNCSWTLVRTYNITDGCVANDFTVTMTYTGSDQDPATGTTPLGVDDINACADESEIDGLYPTSDDEAAIEGAYTDDCGTVVATFVSQTLSGDNCSWTLVRTYNITDGCVANDFPVTMTYTGSDQDPATGTTPAGVDGINACADESEIDGLYPTSDDEAAIEGAYTDDCGTVVATFVSQTLSGDNCSWTLVRTYNITDGCVANDFTVTMTYTGSDQDPATGTTPLGVDDINACADETEIDGLYPTSDDETAIEGAYTDDCGTVVATFVSQTLSGDNCSWTLVRTYNITDGCVANDFTVTMTYTGSDQDPATGTTPLGVDDINACADETEIDGLYPTSDDETAIEGAYTDDCGTVVATFVSQTLSGDNCSWTLVRTYNITDGCVANDFTVTMTYTGSDQDPATGTTPLGVDDVNACADESEIDGLYPTSDDETAIEGAYTDDCGIVEATFVSQVLSGDNCSWTLVRTYNITDGCVANDFTVTMTYTGSDQDPATGTTPDGTDDINACADESEIDAIVLVSADESAIEGAYTDDCGTVTATFTGQLLAGDDCDWSLERSFTVSDGCPANDFTVTITHTGSDQDAPIIEGCPKDFEGDALPDDCKRNVSFPHPTASDDCNTVSRRIVFSDPTMVAVIDTSDLIPLHTIEYNVGSVTTYYIYKDECGNADTCQFDVTIKDVTTPTLAKCNLDTIIDTDPGVCNAEHTFIVPEAYDACGVMMRRLEFLPGTPAPISVPAAVPQIASAIPFTATYEKGETIVRFIAMDYNGLSDTCEFSIIVEDNEDPVVTCIASDTVDTDPGVCEFTIVGTGYDATFTDNCPDGTITNDLNGTATLDGEVLPKGVTTIVWTADDGNGQTATCTTEITVEDNEDPIISCVPDATRSTDAGVCTYTVVGDEFDATFTDNCPDAFITNDLNGTATLDGEVLDKGVTTVVWTVDDGNGQSATCTMTITVEDNEPPTVTCVDDLTVSTDIGVCSYTVAGTGLDASASDNCPGVSLTNDYTGTATLDGAVLPKGATVITWTAVDATGLTSDCTTTITVEDNEAPVFLDLEDMTITTENDFAACPSAIQISVAEGDTVGSGSSFEVSDVSFISPLNVPYGTASNPGDFADNCPDWVVTVDAIDIDSSSCEAVVTITWKVTDCDGNAVTQDQVFTIVDDSPPIGNSSEQGQFNVNACADIAALEILIPIANDIASLDTIFYDNCNDISSSFVSQSISGDNCNWILTRVYSVADVCGNSMLVEYVHGGADQNPATGTTPAGIDGVNACADVAQIAVEIPVSDDESAIEGAYTDDCGVVTATFESEVLSGDNCSWTLERTFVVSDGCPLNDFLVTMTHSGSDQESATGTTPAGVDGINACADLFEIESIQPIAGDEAAIAGAYTDNCGTVTATFDSQVLTGDNCSWTLVRTFIVSDGCSSNDFTVTMTHTGADLDPATGTTPAGIDDINACADEVEIDDIQLISDDEAAIEGAYTDDCGIVTATFESQILNGDNCSWTLERTFVVSDGCQSNDFTVTMTHTGYDQDAPTIEDCPADINETALPDDCKSVISIVPPTATDDCTNTQDITRKIAFSDPTLVSVVDTGSATHLFEFNEGTVTTFYIFTDDCGNSDTCQFNVTVTDETNPEFSNCNDNITAPADLGSCSAELSYVTPIVNDACGIASMSINYLPGTPAPVSVPADVALIGSGVPVTETFEVGVTIVRFIATDVNGNVDSCEFNVTVTDDEPPVAICQDITTYVDENGEAFIDPIDVDGGSSDNCGSLILELSVSAFDCDDIGSPQTTTLIVSDAAGNESSCTANVTVLDTISPELEVQDIQLTFDPADQFIVLDLNDVIVSVEDNCEVDTTYASVDTFFCGDGPIVMVDIFAEDPSGNVTVKTITVTLINSLTASVVYVDLNATGAATGTSWADAFVSLEDAFSACFARVDTVKIAEGVYYPDGVTRDDGFVFSGNVVILGGYQNAGASRDTTGTATVLSGDIGTTSLSNDNAYHTVLIDQDATNVIIENLTIQAGQADGPNFVQQCGGGMLCEGNVKLYNVVFDGNYSMFEGAAVHLKSTGVMMMTESVITNSSASLNGSIFSTELGSDLTIMPNTSIKD